MSNKKEFEYLKNVFAIIGLIFILYKFFTYNGFTTFEIKVANSEEKELVLVEKRFLLKSKIHVMKLINDEWKWLSVHSDNEEKWYGMPAEVHLYNSQYHEDIDRDYPY